MRCRLGLNQSRRDNYVFFDPDAPLHLSIANPVGYTSRVTNSIVTAIKVGKIIDIDNAIDLDSKCFKPVEAPAQAPLMNPNDSQILSQGKVSNEEELPAGDSENGEENVEEKADVASAKAKGKRDKVANESAEK